MNSDIERKLKRFYDKLNQDSRTSKGFVTPEKEKPSTNIENAFNELTNELIQQLSNNQNLLLVIDQFEELVTLCQPLEREYFLKLLAQMLNKYENLKLVLTVRSVCWDYF